MILNFVSWYCFQLNMINKSNLFPSKILLDLQTDVQSKGYPFQVQGLFSYYKHCLPLAVDRYIMQDYTYRIGTILSTTYSFLLLVDVLIDQDSQKSSSNMTYASSKSTTRSLLNQANSSVSLTKNQRFRESSLTTTVSRPYSEQHHNLAPISKLMTTAIGCLSCLHQTGQLEIVTGYNLNKLKKKKTLPQARLTKPK